LFLWYKVRHSVLSEEVLLGELLRVSRHHGLEDPRPTEERGQPNGGRRSWTRSRVRCRVVPPFPRGDPRW